VANELVQENYLGTKEELCKTIDEISPMSVPTQGRAHREQQWTSIPASSGEKEKPDVVLAW
jgi:hypothetical protein